MCVRQDRERYRFPRVDMEGAADSVETRTQGYPRTSGTFAREVCVRDLRDLHLNHVPAPKPPAPAPVWPMVAAAVLVLVLIALGIFGWYSRRARSVPQTATAPSRAEAPPSRSPTPPLGGRGEDIELPPLGESDALVRLLVGRLSAHPAVAAWLTGDGLIRNATVVVQNVAAGGTPARQLRQVAPEGAFAVRKEAGETFVDPRSHQRYNWIADAVASVDTEGAARLYSTLRPRVEEAYAELGSTDTPFDATLERAIIVLLETPVVEGDVRLVTRGALYAYVDPRLEGLLPAQKQVVRTGPRNTRLIQRKLREIALALGITEDRLPAETLIRAR
jgi:hypothetical protein